MQKSLMPKGVDHFFIRALSLAGGGAKIFDAERR